MQRLFLAALTLFIVGSTTGETIAKSALHIERQCTRYGNFCGPGHVAKYTSAKSTSQKAKNVHKPQVHAPGKATVVYRHGVEKEPFIERQCVRYGHFC